MHWTLMLVPLALLIVAADASAGGESRRVFRATTGGGVVAAVGDSKVETQPWQSLADCAVACAADATCVKFGHKLDAAADRVCQRSSSPGYNLGSEAWLDTAKTIDIWDLCPVAVVNGRRFCVMQQRSSPSVSFAKPWSDYENGFGDYENWWIGLRLLHSLTQPNRLNLRVEVTSFGNVSYYFEYAGFRVASADLNYTMDYTAYLAVNSSNSIDSLDYHKGLKFSTMDVDNDLLSGGSCSAANGNGGWWYNECYRCNPNGAYCTNLSACNGTIDLQYIIWKAAALYEPMKFIRMMLEV